MGSIVESIIDFVRIRQLNIAVAFVLTGAYLLYQYWDILTKTQEEEEYQEPARRSRSRSRSVARSRSRSRSYSKQFLDKNRRGRKPHRRCPDCSLCEFEK